MQHPNGKWNSSTSAAYATDLNLFFADALASLVVQLQPVQDDPDVPSKETIAQPIRETAAPLLSNAIKSQSARTTRTVHPTVGDDNGKPSERNVVEMPEESDSSQENVNDTSEESQETSPPPVRRRRPAEKMRRGLGAIHTRSRGAVSVAKGGQDDPGNHWDAMKRDASGWSVAEISEVNNHERERSWSYMPRSEAPIGRRLIKLTWAYKTKRDGRLKARLCVQGCTQMSGVDYAQTYCAAMRAGSLRLLCALAGRYGLRMRRWDSVSAYLQGSLEEGEVVYGRPSPGFSTAVVDGTVRLVPHARADKVQRICRVEKPVYGMAHSLAADGNVHCSLGYWSGEHHTRARRASHKVRMTHVSSSLITQSLRPRDLALNHCTSVVSWTTCSSSQLTMMNSHSTAPS